MKTTVRKYRASRTGLTLIELVVVLVVLIALAGILVPMLPNMIGRSHGASGAASIQEAAKAIQLYEATNMRHPDGWDSLINADGNHILRQHNRFSLTPLSPSPVDEGNPTGEEEEAMELGERIADALNDAGITRSWTMRTGVQIGDTPNFVGFDTFRSYPAGNGRMPTDFQDLTGGGSVVTLGPANDELVRFGFPNPADDPGTVAYVLFGIGEPLSAVGKTISAAPVHFPEPGDPPPSRMYNRYIAIYRIPSTGPAVLATVTALHVDHLEPLGDHLREFYRTIDDNF